MNFGAPIQTETFTPGDQPDAQDKPGFGSRARKTYVPLAEGVSSPTSVVTPRRQPNQWEDPGDRTCTSNTNPTAGATVAHRALIFPLVSTAIIGTPTVSVVAV